MNPEKVVESPEIAEAGDGLLQLNPEKVVESPHVVRKVAEESLVGIPKRELKGEVFRQVVQVRHRIPKRELKDVPQPRAVLLEGRNPEKGVERKEI